MKDPDIIIAATNGRYDEVRQHLDAGVHPDHTDGRNIPAALWMVCNVTPPRRADIQMARELVQRGADPDRNHGQHWTPRRLAEASGKKSLIKAMDTPRKVQ